MSIILSDLPFEILEMIADRVCCSQGYSSFRLTCRKMYHSTRSIKRYHPGGELFEYIPIRRGKPQGISKMYFTDGSIAGIREYDRGVLCNLERLFFKSGKLLHKGYFENGKFTGVHFWYNIDGTLSKAHDFTVSREEHCVEFDKRGNKLMVCKYIRGKLDGPVDFYIGDTPHISFRYNNGIMNGTITIVSLHHSISFVGRVVDDLLHGDQVLYNEDGDVKCIIPLFNGRKNGLLRRYYSSGRLMSVVKYVNNLRYGVEKVWWANGKLKVFRNWDKGVKSGLCRLYNNEAIITHKCNFKNNKLDGLSIKYTPEGFPETVSFYKEGNMLNNIIYYHHNTGNIYQVNFLENNKANTNFTSFFNRENNEKNIKTIRYERGIFRFNLNNIVIPESNNKITNLTIKLANSAITRYTKNENLLTETFTCNGNMTYL